MVIWGRNKAHDAMTSLDAGTVTRAPFLAWSGFLRMLPVVACFMLLACAGANVSDADLIADPTPADEDNELGTESVMEENEARDEFNGQHGHGGGGHER